MLEANSLVLDYEAEAYAHAAGSGGDEDTKQEFSSDEPADVQAQAGEVELEWCGPQEKYDAYLQKSLAGGSIEGSYDLNGVRLMSTLAGSGWGYFRSDCTGADLSWTGGGSGNGHTLLNGTIGIAMLEGYESGILEIDAEIFGDSPSSWESLDWWLKIWDDDPNNPLAVLNQNNMSAEIAVVPGHLLDIKLYQTGQKNGWPESGLSTTVSVQFDIFPNIADIDGDGDVDLVDYAILASQWLDVPGVPSADIAPADGGDNIVDWLDLDVLADYWLAGL